LPALKQVSLEVCAGEILGVAGVSGNGQSELSRVLSGTLKPTSGKLFVSGQDLTGADPTRMLSAGVGRIPEERRDGVLEELSVAENLAMENLGEFTRNSMLDRRRVRKEAQRLIDEYQIKASPSDRMRTLSGGNVQKVILARALARKPLLIIAAQPTRGLDVGATEYVRGKLVEQRNLGAAVLLLSEDLEEILLLSDRIAVIYEGRIVGVLPAREASLEQLGMMMSGAAEVTSA
jgi:simple sugar transport system ATP-binding protein